MRSAPASVSRVYGGRPFRLGGIGLRRATLTTHHMELYRIRTSPNGLCSGRRLLARPGWLVPHLAECGQVGAVMGRGTGHTGNANAQWRIRALASHRQKKKNLMFAILFPQRYGALRLLRCVKT